MYDNSTPRKGRYITLPPNPKRERIGNPYAAHPLPTMPKSELPPTTNRNLLLFFNIFILLKSKVRFAPVSNAIKNNMTSPEPLIAVHIP